MNTYYTSKFQRNNLASILLLFQGLLTFKDVILDISQEEWEFLYCAHRVLHIDVIEVGELQYLVSLGKNILLVEFLTHFLFVLAS